MDGVIDVGAADSVSGADTGQGRQPRPHVLRELGLELSRSGDEIHGWAPVWPEMWAPGTSSLRVSILAAWADTLAGYLAIDVLEPRVPVTLSLDVDLYRPVPGDGPIRTATTASSP